jgi:hypothetical protein
MIARLSVDATVPPLRKGEIVAAIAEDIVSSFYGHIQVQYIYFCRKAEARRAESTDLLRDQALPESKNRPFVLRRRG